jgi:hypothetical protein
MNRSMALSVVVLVVSLFIGSAFKAQAVAAPASSAGAAVQSADGSTGRGYWTAWADAASH